MTYPSCFDRLTELVAVIPVWFRWSLVKFYPVVSQEMSEQFADEGNDGDKEAGTREVTRHHFGIV